ncbi:MAG: hypothetical protein RLZZ70_732 [Candidatus Parcubacteria bacterium]|jgi:hypothetical protein
MIFYVLVAAFFANIIYICTILFFPKQGGGDYLGAELLFWFCALGAIVLWISIVTFGMGRIFGTGVLKNTTDYWLSVVCTAIPTIIIFAAIGLLGLRFFGYTIGSGGNFEMSGSTFEIEEK